MKKVLISETLVIAFTVVVVIIVLYFMVAMTTKSPTEKCQRYRILVEYDRKEYPFDTLMRQGYYEACLTQEQLNQTRLELIKAGIPARIYANEDSSVFYVEYPLPEEVLPSFWELYPEEVDSALIERI